MIELRNISKSYFLNGQETVVADNISIAFPPKRTIAILGRNGAGKSSLLRMISGAMEPDQGEVRRHGTVSWPVGFAGSFHGELTGLQNVRFIGRVYGVDTDELVEFVSGFAEIGKHFSLPVRSYSSGMRSRLAFGVSMGIHFDTYLIDEITAVGDLAFRKKSESVLQSRLATSSAYFVSHGMQQVARLCHHGAVLDRGHLYFYEDIHAAIKHHTDLQNSI